MGNGGYVDVYPSAVEDCDSEEEHDVFEEETTTTPVNDPDQYLWRGDGDEAGDEMDVEGVGDAPAPGFDAVAARARVRPAGAGVAAVPAAVDALAAAAGKLFTSVGTRPLPASLARRNITAALFITRDGRVVVTK